MNWRFAQLKMEMSYAKNSEYSHEYFQPYIGRNIRIFSLGQKKTNNILRKKECVGL